MKPLNLITLLLFLAGTVWALTRSEKAVHEIQGVYYTALRPFLSSGSAIEIRARRYADEVKHSAELAAQLEEAQDQLGILRTEVSHLRKLEHENIQLRAALHFQKQSPFAVTAAKLIRRKPSTWWQTATIDRGEQSGIGVQLPVLAAEGLVGKIDRTDQTNSSIILLTDEACQVSAKIGNSQEVGILSGQRVQPTDKPILRLRYLSKDANIKPGSKVYTTGRGGLFPADILLGTIISSDSGAFDAEARVEPAVDFAALNTVFVLTGNK